MILCELRQRGVTIRVEEGKICLRPESELNDGILDLIRQHKPEILRELLSPPLVTQPKTARPIECRYNWAPGYRFLRLYCVAHQHEIGASTVFRTAFDKRDVLAEMARLGILTGQALEDSRAVGQNPDQNEKELSKMNEYLAWFDGACEPVNPGGTATSGVIVRDKEGTVLLKEGRLVGKGEAMSNNVAEYSAIIQVFQYLMSCSPGHAIVRGDSTLVIKQLNGEWGAHAGLYYVTYLKAKELLSRLRGLGWKVDLLWIPRTENEQCDALSKKALAEAGALPAPYQYRRAGGMLPKYYNR
jgi:ribonuclease HI